jgi:ribosomal protein S12 methylthiotransferase accessory factor
MTDRFHTTNVWSLAADLFECKAVTANAEADAGAALLTRLGFGPSDAVGPADRHVRIALLRFAASMTDVFELAAPDAPGLAFLGGMTSPSMHRSKPLLDPSLSAGGRGASFGGAFMSCVGEAIERVSQYQSEGDRLARRSLAAGLAGQSAATAEAFAEMLEGYPTRPDQEIDWLPGRALTHGTECMVPADLCLVRPRDPAQPPLSTSVSLGCASGATNEQAMASGLLELIERDAAALWWLASRPPRLVAMETLEQAGVLALVQKVRRGTATRRSWFLDITSELGIPCVVALSFLAEGGGFAHGVAARLTLGAAAAAAFLEMCQMEVAYHLVAMKIAASGEQKLSPADRRHKLRFELLDPDRHSILLPSHGPAQPRAAEDPASDLSSIVLKLQSSGFECLAADLTRPEIDVPVFKLFVPGLQPTPSDVRTARLRQALDARPHTSPINIPLF